MNNTKKTLKSFSFENEERISSVLDILGLFRADFNGSYYELPFSINAHSKYFYKLLYLRSALQAKANILASCLKNNPLISQQEIVKLAMDFLWFGNAYVQKVENMKGQIIALRHSPAKYTRKTKDGFIFLNNEFDEPYEFPKGSIFHLKQYDVNQEIYGVPEWLPAVQSALLNDEATNFRLRYYRNGSHAGYIMYLTDPNLLDEDVEDLQEQLAQSKGPGNFRNLLLYAPNGKSDGLKLLPISEVTAKDEFLNIKSISRDDQLAAARIPPNIMGIVPTNTSGFGSIEPASKVFARNEILPLAKQFEQINLWLNKKAFEFEDYTIEDKK